MLFIKILAKFHRRLGIGLDSVGPEWFCCYELSFHDLVVLGWCFLMPARKFVLDQADPLVNKASQKSRLLCSKKCHCVIDNGGWPAEQQWNGGHFGLFWPSLRKTGLGMFKSCKP
jgi:hypothetical protein